MRKWFAALKERMRTPVFGRTPASRLGTVAICAFAGFMLTISALASTGGDLRPNRSTDLVELVRTLSQRNAGLSSDVAALREQVDALAARKQSNPAETKSLAAATDAAAMTDRIGPGVTVTLDDAPADVKPPGVAGDLLVVHQQDIQAVTNALWSGGAEAMSVQGVRITSQTGIKCVGNSIVLHGVPYAPPYVIVTLGDPGRLSAALESSPEVKVYKQYVAAYQLGYALSTFQQQRVPGFRGSTELRWASPAR